MLKEIRHHDLYLTLYVVVGTRPDSLTVVRTDSEIPGYFEVRYVPETNGMGLTVPEPAPILPRLKPAESESELSRARALGLAILNVIRGNGK